MSELLGEANLTPDDVFEKCMGSDTLPGEIDPDFDCNECAPSCRCSRFTYRHRLFSVRVVQDNGVRLQLNGNGGNSSCRHPAADDGWHGTTSLGCSCGYGRVAIGWLAADKVPRRAV